MLLPKWKSLAPPVTVFILGLLLVVASQVVETPAQIKELEDLRSSPIGITMVPDWAISTSYATNQVVIESGTFYRRTVAGTSGVLFDANQWVQVAVPVGRTLTVSATAGESSIAEGSQDLSISRTFTIGIADNATLPGTDGVTVPVGTTAEEPAGTSGQVRYDSDTDKLRVFVNGAWTDAITTGGVSHVVIDQSSATGAVPVLQLDQADIDDSFVDFVGTSAADGSRSVSSDTTVDSAKFGAIRVEINGVTKWLRVYDDES